MQYLSRLPMLFKKMYSKSQLVPFFPLSPRLLKRKNFKRENKDEKQVQAKTHLHTTLLTTGDKSTYLHLSLPVKLTTRLSVTIISGSKYHFTCGIWVRICHLLTYITLQHYHFCGNKMWGKKTKTYS